MEEAAAEKAAAAVIETAMEVEDEAMAEAAAEETLAAALAPDYDVV
jgi:hypothetical protein